MYVSKKNTLEIPFDFQTYMAKAEEKALVDSGATENFINHKTVKQLHLGTKALTLAQPVFNVDRTHNKAGTIDQMIHLYVTLGDKEQRLQFFVTDLGKDQMILEYPWLQKFNPRIDWAQGQLQGRLKVQTTVSKAQEAKHMALCL
jgi:Retroviral aspartyl protease